MIFYHSEYCTIKYFEKEKLIFTQYHSFTPSEELKKILEAMLDLVSSKEVVLSLSDRRKMKVIRPSDQDYINNVWFPKYLKNSKIKKSAYIESLDVFNRIAVENILKKAESLIPFEKQTFDSMENACKWLDIDCNNLVS